MQTFMATIARPISPDDEHLDYVPTQAVAEYLNSEHLVWMGKEKRHIDAIIYTSAQRPPGKNIVFLGHAAMTEPVDPPAAKRGVAVAPSFDLSILTRPLLSASGLEMLPGSLSRVTITRADFGHETEQLVSPNFRANLRCAMLVGGPNHGRSKHAVDFPASPVRSSRLHESLRAVPSLPATAAGRA